MKTKNYLEKFRIIFLGSFLFLGGCAHQIIIEDLQSSGISEVKSTLDLTKPIKAAEDPAEAEQLKTMLGAMLSEEALCPGLGFNLPIEFTACSSPETAVLATEFKRTDWRVFSPHSKGIAYDAMPILTSGDTSSGLEKDDSGQNLGETSLDYTFKSPWTILESNFGTIIDANTLNYKTDDIQNLPATTIIVLEAKMSDISKNKMAIPFAYKLKIAALMQQLKAKLDESSLSLEQKQTAVNKYQTKFRNWSQNNQGKKIVADFAIKKLDLMLKAIKSEPANGL